MPYPTLKRSLRIASLTFDSPLVLAPMTGLGHIAYREVLAGFGGYAFMVTEMCSAKALPHENRHHSLVFRWRDEEVKHLVCQIFGAEPQEMAEAARRIQAEGFLGVDINMGCSVSAICRRGCGAALLNDPQRALAIVQAVRAAVTCPVMVKYRSGWEKGPDVSVTLARHFEDAGADLLTLHPRLAPDRRSRPPKWERIQAAAEAVSIPVLGNGDVFCASHCQQILKTGCAGVAIGRMAIARPWIFAELTGTFIADADVFLRTSLAVIDSLWRHFEPDQALRAYKKYAVYLAANFVFGHSLWPELVRGDTREVMEENAHRVLAARPRVAATPNAFLFTA